MTRYQIYRPTAALYQHHPSSRGEVPGTRFQALVAQEIVALGTASRAETHENHRPGAFRLNVSISSAVPDRCLKYIGEQTPVVRVSPVGPAHQVASATGGFQRRCYRRREALRVLLVEEGCVRSGDGMQLGVVSGGMETPDDYEIVRRRRCHLLEEGAPPSAKISFNAGYRQADS